MNHPSSTNLHSKNIVISEHGLSQEILTCFHKRCRGTIIVTHEFLVIVTRHDLFIPYTENIDDCTNHRTNRIYPERLRVLRSSEPGRTGYVLHLSVSSFESL